MLDLKIRTKIYLLCGLYSVVGLASTLFLVHRVSALNEQFNVFQNARVHKLDEELQMQLNFKKQVQEWKDILLRGYDPQNLEKYQQNFFRQEDAVKKNLE